MVLGGGSVSYERGTPVVVSYERGTPGGDCFLWARYPRRELFLMSEVPLWAGGGGA